MVSTVPPAQLARASPPSEFVIDAEIRQLNVAPVSSETVAGRQSAGRNWERKGLAVQPNVVVF
jgi:hypothetical protein